MAIPEPISTAGVGICDLVALGLGLLPEIWGHIYTQTATPPCEGNGGGAAGRRGVRAPPSGEWRHVLHPCVYRCLAVWSGALFPSCSFVRYNLVSGVQVGIRRLRDEQPLSGLNILGGQEPCLPQLCARHQGRPESSGIHGATSQLGWRFPCKGSR